MLPDKAIESEILSDENKEVIRDHVRKVCGIREVLKRDHMKVQHLSFIPNNSFNQCITKLSAFARWCFLAELVMENLPL